MQLQRPFVNGFNMMLGYNYNRARQEEFYDDLDTFLNNLTWQTIRDPRHRITGAALYQLPFGKGRRFLSGANRMTDAVLGGWGLSGIYTFNSGELLRFRRRCDGRRPIRRESDARADVQHAGVQGAAGVHQTSQPALSWSSWAFVHAISTCRWRRSSG
jgi:hypothetical protein